MSYGYMNKETLLELSRTFTGLKHRFETVGVFDGVRYINSSIDSTPTRTIATLSNLKNNVILILGGKSKGLDYSPLVTALKDKVKLLILVGENRYEIEDAFLSCNEFPMMKIPLLKFKGLFSGIDYAYEKAEKGDTVILSPASTSYDEFKNFEERGYAFSDYIKTKME